MGRAKSFTQKVCTRGNRVKTDAWRHGITARLNAVYADDEAPDLGLATLQARSLAHDPW